MDTPAGNSSGSSPTPTREDRSRAQEEAGGTFELPAKLRVHALAKLLGASSREIIIALDRLGEPVRSAQSNITRDVALRVVQSLRPEQIAEPDPAGQDGADQAAAGPAESDPRPQSTQSQPAESQSADSQSADSQSADSQPADSDPAGSRPADSPTEANPADEQSDSAVLAPIFAAPQAMFLAPEPTPARPAAAKPEQPEAEEQPAKSTPKQNAKTDAKPDTKTDAKPETKADIKPDTKPDVDDSDEDDEDDDGEQGNRRRRRRGRRGRGRGRGGDGDQAESGGTEQDSDGADGGGKRQGKKDDSPKNGGKKDKAEPAEKEDDTAGEKASDSDSDSESGESSRRRRRRRRRKGTSDDESGTREDDPPNTVVHVREAAQENGRQESSDDEVRAIKGSTRLEAKRQRRRDGREAGRRRAPVLSEAEFLARRESVDRKMVVRENGDQTQIAVLEDNILVENFVTSSGTGSLVGNVYLGRVQNVLPSMEAAFVDIGRGRNAVLYAGEVDWDAAGLAGKARRIEQALSTGDSVLVQVTKDPVGHKGARLTTQISLPGRFLVYVPGGGATGISRKLPDNERKRLKEILKRIVPENAGVIIRTASEGTSEEALDRDVRRLQAQWEVIKEKADVPKAQAPQLLYEEPDLLIKVVRDLFTEDFSAMTVQGNDAWETIESYVQHVAPDLASRLSKHVGKNDVFTEQRISEQISKALDRKVWLPSGGYLVIDRTEAMTVIDVNTGKYTGSGGNLEETVTRNNLEAAEEIVRQLRLRDIGGIIVIDFIDMVLESNRDLVLRRLTECLGRDRTRHQVAEVTSLGLVQMTRKRVGTGLLEAYSSTCEHCRGRGLVVSTDPVTHVHGNQPGNGGNNGGGGNGGGQSRRNRNRKQDNQSDSGSSAESANERADDSRGDDRKSRPAEAAQAEPAAAAPSGAKDRDKPAKPEPVESKAAQSEAVQSKAAQSEAVQSKAAQSGAVQPKAAKPEPVEPKAAEPKDAEPKAAQPKAAQPEPAEARPAEPKQAEVKPAAEQPKPAEAAPTEPATEQGAPATSTGRSKRRKVSRPTSSAGAAAGPVVLTPAPAPSTGGEESGNGVPQVPQPATATVTKRSRRRSASRPAGPPVEGAEDEAAGVSAES